MSQPEAVTETRPVASHTNDGLILNCSANKGSGCDRNQPAVRLASIDRRSRGVLRWNSLGTFRRTAAPRPVPSVVSTDSSTTSTDPTVVDNTTTSVDDTTTSTQAPTTTSSRSPLQTMTVPTTPTTEACKPGWGYGDTNHCHSGPPGHRTRRITQNPATPTTTPSTADTSGPATFTSVMHADREGTTVERPSEQIKGRGSDQKADRAGVGRTSAGAAQLHSGSGCSAIAIELDALLDAGRTEERKSSVRALMFSAASP